MCMAYQPYTQGKFSVICTYVNWENNFISIFSMWFCHSQDSKEHKKPNWHRKDWPHSSHGQLQKDQRVWNHRQLPRDLPPAGAVQALLVRAQQPSLPRLAHGLPYALRGGSGKPPGGQDARHSLLGLDRPGLELAGVSRARGLGNWTKAVACRCFLCRITN